MKFFLTSGLILLVILAQGCGQTGTEESSSEVPSIADIERQDAVESLSEQAGAVPVLSPEDQKKADSAPQGMVFIKGGCFTMGNDNTQADEKYEHQVCLDDFYMDRHEVTQARWQKVMSYNPSKFVGADHPVEQINYYDILEFIETSGGPCRLPTEAEFEYASRGGASTRYFWGNLMDGEYAWYVDNSEGTTHPVGQKKPNAYGLYDVSGNVWEWTQDWYGILYQPLKVTNPTGPVQGEHKVVRGGGFDTTAGGLRTTNRTWIHPKNRVFSKVTTFGSAVNEIYNFIGFRCVQSIPAELKTESPATKTPTSGS